MVVRVRFDKLASDNFKRAIEYIRNDSPVNADKVKRDILLFIRNLLKQPEKYPLDKYILNNDGNFRAFELHRYRISYIVKKEEVVITDVRHTSRKPMYK